MSAFFIVASIILFFMQVCIGLWFYFVFPAIGWKVPAILIPLLVTVFIRWSMAYTRTHYGTLESIAYYAAYLLAGLIFIAFCIVMLCAVIQAISSLFRIYARPVLTPVSMGLLLLATVLSIYGGFSRPQIRPLSMTWPGSPSLKIAIISDSHLGEGVSVQRLEEALDRMQQQQPDLLLVLGDLYEYGMNRAHYAQALANFKTTYGSFGVLGNHEYYMGYQNSVDFYKQAGITLLQNQIHTLPNGVQLIGINDIKTARVTAEQVDRLLAQTDPKSPRILLSHQPLLTETVARHEIPLMLSGHTHNGQIFPFNFLVKWKYPYIYGWYEIGPHSKIYVTSGLFYWGIPLRLLAPAEFPLLHLQGNV